MSRRLSLSLVLASLALASAASAQISAYFRVEIGAPVGGAAPVVTVQPFAAPAYSLSDRTAIQHMWEGMEFQLTPVARECAMPLGVEIDAGSFAGRLVAGTDDGLHPGTRSRYRDLARALTAVCHRGDMERGAVQGRIRSVRFAFTDGAADQVTLEGGTLVFRTNGDMSGSGHLGYAQMIDWITGHL